MEKNPDVTIKTIQNDKIVEQKPLATYDIDGKNIMAVVKKRVGENQKHYIAENKKENKILGNRSSRII